MIELTKLVKTCGACPAQWEGRDKMGKRYYFRFRSGFFYVRQCPVTTCLEGPVVFEWEHPTNGWAGEMKTDEMKELTKSVFDWSKTKCFIRKHWQTADGAEI